MQVSDFTSQHSVHALLYAILASEIGLSSVSHPTAQVTGVLHAFADLRDRLVATKGQPVTLTFEDGEHRNLAKIEIDWKAEGSLFIHLYNNINQFEQDQLHHEHIYPLIGRMVRGNPELHDVVQRQSELYIGRHGRAAGKRVIDTLSMFGLDKMALTLNRHPIMRASETDACQVAP